MRKSMLSMILVVVMLMVFMAGCEHTTREIPSGYTGKVLTPSGFSKKILDPGIVKVGRVKLNGSFTSLVLLESSTCTVKEEFIKDGAAGDDRIRLKDGTPIAVDLYVQIGVPQNEDIRNSIFAQITPTKTTVDRVSEIKLDDIYQRLAKMSIRGKCRAQFSKYNSPEEVMASYEAITADIYKDIQDIFEATGTPLELINVALGNVKEDSTILASQNKIAESENEVKTINAIGAAIRNNPGYLAKLKYDTLLKVGTTSQNMIIMDTNANIVVPTK